ncbi:hypothetical protein [Actinoplanes sp. NPDC049265]|uniref:hypothetical protein n=1 Tax=Actinoplanes sp. NPDC049265 TaxID=3363902 RepID=UPI003711D94D
MTAFDTGVQRLISQVAHWAENRWRAPAANGPGTRGDAVYALVQQLADLGADAEERPRRPVPRLHDMVLPDQLRVVADELSAVGVPGEATAAVEETRRLLAG